MKELLILKEKVLGQLERREPIDMAAVAELKEAYGAATHDGPCPCGSGQPFGRCCKLDLLAINGIGEKAEEESKPEEASEAPEKKVDEQRAGADWICRVGVDKQGNLVVEPMPHAVNMPPIRIAELLLGAYHQVNFNATIATIRAMMMRSRPAGPAVRSAFK